MKKLSTQLPAHLIVLLLITVIISSCKPLLPSAASIAMTATPDDLQSSTKQSQITPFVTLASTLSSQQREKRVLDLLQTNANCVLPCWWGIVPGKTMWSETKAFIESLGAKTSDNQTSGTSSYHGTSGFDLEDNAVYNRVEFVEHGGVVEGINIYSFGDNASQWTKIWSNFSPAYIISRYGSPDRMWLMTSSQVHEAPVSAQMPYELWFFYDYLKFLIRYAGVVQYAPVYRFCPAYGENGQLIPDVRIFLADPVNPTSLETLSNALSTVGKTDYIQPIEKATGLTVKQVSSLLIQGGSQACFNASRNNWP